MSRVLLVLMAATLLTLTACGKKGEPQAPPGETNIYPKTYPPLDKSEVQPKAPVSTAP